MTMVPLDGLAGPNQSLPFGENCLGGCPHRKTGNKSYHAGTRSLAVPIVPSSGTGVSGIEAGLV